jgi:hypothetical protein
MQSYLDATARNALDALVASLEVAVKSAADQAIVRPLDDLRARLTGLGEREAAVLERLDVILSASGAQSGHLNETKLTLEGALETAAERTVKDLSREIQTGLERMLPTRVFEIWGARLEEAFASALNGVHQRLDRQAELDDNARRDMALLSSRLDALQEDARQALASQAARDEATARSNAELQNGLAQVAGAEENERGRASWRADLEASAEQVSTEIKRTLVPAATLLDARLVTLTSSCESANSELSALSKAHGKTHEALKSLEAGLMGGLSREFTRHIGPLQASAEQQTSVVGQLRSALQDTQTALGGRTTVDEQTTEHLSQIKRHIESFSERLTLIQEAFVARAAYSNRAVPLVGICLGLLVINLAATIVLFCAAAARHMLW